MASLDAKRFVSDYATALNAHDPQGIMKYYADSVEITDSSSPVPLRGKEGIRKNFQQWSDGFSEMSIDLHDVVQSGNKVVLRYTGKGRNTGEFSVSPGETLSPTNKSIRLEFAEFLTLDDSGKIVRDDSIYDTASLLVQLGLMPGPEKPRDTRESRTSPTRAH